MSSKLFAYLEAPPRFELGHKGVADLGLTAWLWYHAFTFLIKKNGAGNEIRTRDVHLGKVTLYH